MLSENEKVDLLIPLVSSIQDIEKQINSFMERGANGVYLIERDSTKTQFLIRKEGYDFDIGLIETKGTYGEVRYVEVCNVDYFENVSYLISVLKTAPNMLLQMKLIGLVRESK